MKKVLILIGFVILLNGCGFGSNNESYKEKESKIVEFDSGYIPKKKISDHEQKKTVGKTKEFCEIYPKASPCSGYIPKTTQSKKCKRVATISFCEIYPKASPCYGCGFERKYTTKQTPIKKSVTKTTSVTETGRDELIQFCEDEGFANTEKGMDRCGDYIRLKQTQAKDSDSTNKDDEILDEIKKNRSFDHYQGLWRMGRSTGLW